MGICFTEATNSILKWMDITGDISQTIKSTLPSCMKGQPLKVLFSSGPEEYDTLPHVAAEHLHRGLPRE